MDRDLRFEDALRWFGSADNTSVSVLAVERAAVLSEIERLKTSHDPELKYRGNWASHIFKAFYANRNVHSKAQQLPQQTNSSIMSSRNSSSASEGLLSTDFICVPLERYVNKDMFPENVTSLSVVRELFSALKKSYNQWVTETSERVRVEMNHDISMPVEWPVYTLKCNIIPAEHKRSLQLLKTIALSKKGFSLSKNDFLHLSSLFDDEHTGGLIGKDYQDFAQLDKARVELNAKLEMGNMEYYQIACEKANKVWRPILTIIELIERKLGELDGIVGEEAIEKALDKVGESHGMHVFYPFDKYWHPMQEILKKKQQKNVEKVDAEIGSALAKYFRFYRDVIDGNNGIPVVVKSTVSNLLDFMRSFCAEYSENLKNLSVSTRPEVTEKITNDSLLSFDGLIKVTEGRIKELVLDMDERRGEILDDIVEFIDILSIGDEEGENKPQRNLGRLDALRKSEIAERFRTLDGKLISLVRSVRSYLSLSFPALHLLLIGYMIVKFFVYEKTFEESKVVSTCAKEKLGSMLSLIKQRDRLVSEFQNGFNSGALELCKIYTSLFRSELLRSYDDYLKTIKEQEEDEEEEAEEEEIGQIQINEENEIHSDDNLHLIKNLEKENLELIQTLSQVEEERKELAESKEALLKLCSTYRVKISELEMELCNVRMNFTPPTTTPSTRAISPVSPRPMPIGSHLNLNKNSFPPTLFSPWLQ